MIAINSVYKNYYHDTEFKVIERIKYLYVGHPEYVIIESVNSKERFVIELAKLTEKIAGQPTFLFQRIDNSNN
jgi:hypothetical protein